MKDFWDQIALLKDASLENPVILRIHNGDDEVDILVTDAAISKNSFVKDECQQLHLTTGPAPEDDPYWDEYWDGDGPYDY